MRKNLIRFLVVSAAFTGLALGGWSGLAPSSAHHDPGHHCFGPNQRETKFENRQDIRALKTLKKQADSRAERRALQEEIKEERHDTHKCAPGRYPPS